MLEECTIGTGIGGKSKISEIQEDSRENSVSEEEPDSKVPYKSLFRSSPSSSSESALFDFDIE